MEERIFGIILLVESPNAPRKKVYETELYGKTLLQWAAMSFGGGDCVTFPFNHNVLPEELPRLLGGVTDPSSDYTVVLYSDTPLITKNTISDALTELVSTGGNVLQLTRGFVFKTEFLLGGARMLAPVHFYADEEDFLTVTDYKQFALISDILRNRILHHHMSEGVLIYDAATTYIDADVSIGKDVVIHPGNILKGKTVIGNGVVLSDGNYISDSVIGDGATLTSSRLYGAKIGDRTTVGPFAYLRAGTVVGAECRIGDFVEIKNSIVGDGSKISHLAYCGDCEIGIKCNIGCGVVIVNYDGKSKSKTIINDRAFVGSNSNLIAPLVLEENCFIAAGSTITDDVPRDALAIARQRQVVKPDWRKKQD